MVSLSFLVSSPCAPRKRNRTVRQDSKRPSGADNAWIVHGFHSEMGYPFKALKYTMFYG